MTRFSASELVSRTGSKYEGDEEEKDEFHVNVVTI